MEWSRQSYPTSFSSRSRSPEDRSLDRRNSITHLYLRVQVTSGIITTNSVRKYFVGLDIADILSFKDNHALIDGGALVKFYNSSDAYEGMRRYRYSNSKALHVMWSNEKEWVRYGGRVHYDEDNLSYTSRYEREEYYSRSPERFSHSSFRDSSSKQWHSRSLQRYSQSQQKYSRSPGWHSRSPLNRSRSPRLRSRSPRRRSRSPRRHERSPVNLSNEQDPIYDGDFHVHVTNLNYDIAREDLRRWFFSLVSKDHIKFLYDEKGRKTRECFVVFKNEKDYKKVLKLDKVMFKGRLLFISPISKSSMRNLLTGKNVLFSHHYSKGRCLYLRNFPPAVTKNDIMKFFAGFSLNEEDISLLCDKNGIGQGEVMVSFSSEEDLERAEKLHRKKFKDKEIKLRKIPVEKLPSFFCVNSLSLMPEDPNDCVTQEDDLFDEDDERENDMDEDDNIPDEDTGFHETENTNECVAQADDTPDDPVVLVNDAPDDPAVLVNDASDDPAVLVNDAPDDPAVLVNDAPDDPAVLVNDAPDDPAVLVNDAPDDPAVLVNDAPDDPAVLVNDAPSTECISNENAVQLENKNAIPEGPTSSDNDLGQ
ncbi:RNA-binding protein 12B-A-like isoform X1 [Bufo bufo]|uniref:RNA-binding protein 12B-A-like isoform X1 n=1 Tax=Bufo bufo TaxID=8384 RepID=UPI001ABDEF3E|nr:RNA-binding protein 12B-A-like isoform X1 [Bufo bufo]